MKNKANSKKDFPSNNSVFNLRSALKNHWIWLLAVLFVIADRCLFIANADPDSKVTVMTLIKQSSCFVTIIAGKFIFHEKKILHKFLCACIIVAGNSDFGTLKIIKSQKMQIHCLSRYCFRLSSEFCQSCI